MSIFGIKISQGCYEPRRDSRLANGMEKLASNFGGVGGVGGGEGEGKGGGKLGGAGNGILSFRRWWL